MANPEVKHGLTRRQLLIATGGTLAGGAGLAYGLGELGRALFTPKEKAAAAPPSPAPEPTFTLATVPPTEAPKPTQAPEPTFPPVPPTPEQPSPTPPDPTEAPTFTPTGTPTPTETPVPPATATATPVEATPIKIPEKSPLPADAVWMGDLLDDKGAKIGKIELISIPPDKDKPEQILINYLMKNGSLDIYLVNIHTVQGNSFEASIRTPRTCVGQTVRADNMVVIGNFDSPSRVLTGVITTKRMGTVEVVTFQTGFMGTGEGIALDVAKQVKFNSGKFTGDWRSLNVDPAFTRCLWFG